MPDAGAVSRQIAALENWFGFPLFERHARGLRLSPQGSALYPELQSAFGRLITVAEQARQQQTVVRLKAPTCAIRWLVPKLLEIERRYPELQVALTTTTEHRVNFKTEPYDAAIIFGTHQSAGDLLFEEALTPVASPDTPCDPQLSGTTFLHPTRDKTDWLLWLAHFPHETALKCIKPIFRHHGSGDHRRDAGARRGHGGRNTGCRGSANRATMSPLLA